MKHFKPIRRQGLVKKRMGDETLLYDVQVGKIHILNRVANKIWDLCDGQNSEDDILQQLRNEFKVSSDYDLLGDVRQALSNFNHKGLLHSEIVHEPAV
jgi:coenzyme PQQ synthesis protein D (PqqD)